jgi:type II secretion system protein G
MPECILSAVPPETEDQSETDRNAMSSRTPALRRIAPAVLLCSMSLRAQSPPAAADGLAKLVPVGTVVYVQAPSLERLGAAIHKTVAAFSAEAAEKFDVDSMLHDMQMPGSGTELDKTKPIAFCLLFSPTPDAEPTPAFLVPAMSPEAFARAVVASGKHATAHVDGGYVLVSESPDVKSGSVAAAIATGLPAGEVVARIDVKQIVDRFRPHIEMGLGQLEAMAAGMPPQATNGMNVAPFMKLYVDGIRSVIDSGQSLDLALRLDGNRLEIASALTVLDKSALAEFGSKEKTDAKALARFVDAGATFQMVAGVDQAMLMKRMKPMLDAVFAMYPEPMRAGFQKLGGSFDELAAQMGSGMCVSGDLGGGGLRYACYVRPRDPAKLLAIYRTMLSSMPGMSCDEVKDGNIAGVPVTRWRVRFDTKVFFDAQGSTVPAESTTQLRTMMEKMYGKDGLAFTFATQGDVTAIVIGGDDAYLGGALARLSANGKPPASIARALDQVGSFNPCFAMSYDLGKVMHGVQEMMGGSMQGMPLDFPNVSASITVSAGVDGRVWRGAMSADLGELGAAVHAIEGASANTGLKTKAQIDVAALVDALQAYAIANGGKYPDSLEVLVTRDVNGQTFLDRTKLPKDPWGRDYHYDPPKTANGTPRVYSYGKDGQPGGTGENADIVNEPR